MFVYYNILLQNIFCCFRDESSSRERADVNYGVGSKEKGPCFTTIQQIDQNLLNVIKDSKDKRVVVYNNESRLFMKSDQSFGQLKIFESKFGEKGAPSILVKKGDVVEHLRKMIETKAGSPVKLYAKDESESVGCFVDGVMNCFGEKCINTRVNGVPTLLPLSELGKQIGAFTFILKSKMIKRAEKTGELTWSLSIVEIDISPIPKLYEGYFRVCETPELQFVTQL